MLCGHCGFAGGLNKKSSATIKTGGYAGTPPSFFDCYQWHIHACVMQCSSCEDLTFYTYREWEFQDPDEWPMEVLYPQPPDTHDLPDVVRESYKKAFPVKTSDPATFVVRVGSVLEAICAEQGISSNKKLQSRLKDLAPKLPDTLADMADHLRTLRNRGAHGDTVEASDAEIAADFAEAILDHLYRNPAKLRRVSHI